MVAYKKLFLEVGSVRLVHSRLRQYTPLLFTTEGVCHRFHGGRMLMAKLDFWLKEESATWGQSRESWATVSLWGCCWSAIHDSSRVTEVQRRIHSGGVETPTAAEQQESALRSDNKYWILFSLLWVTRTPHKELIFSPLYRPCCKCRTLLNLWDLNHL